MPTFAASRARQTVYWIITAIVALETSVGGIMDLARTEHVRAVVTHLGYPLYLLTILGLWKVPGGVVLLIPRLPRLRTWAYAGIFFEMSGAAFSHALFHDTMYVAITSTFTLLTLASWLLEPPNRASAT
jgi:uncharacterized membrane protein YphA (DoxX/SURF4 family)